MAYNFRKEIIDKNNRKRIEAICDECGAEIFVRRDWATGKIKKDRLQYFCGTCTRKKNVKKARRARVVMEQGFIDEFIWLCEQIYINLYDDFHPKVIAKKLESESYNFIEMAREFVYQYLNTGIDDDRIYQCAEKIESNTEQEIIDLYPWETELRARALLHLEALPRPDGL